jgi:hypothetical protein
MKQRMKGWTPRGVLRLLLTVLCLAAFGIVGSAAEESVVPPKSSGAAGARQPVQVELQGKVVCLPEMLHERYGTELSAGHPHVYGFETEEGIVYTLLRTRYSEALFVDGRLRGRELRLKGRVFPETQVFEVQRTRAVRQGVLYDVYYYCSICHIETVSPGPCECCQGPVELTEKPLRQTQTSRQQAPRQSPATGHPLPTSQPNR